MVASGLEGVTLYMETYHRDTYSRVHLRGKKRDYDYRLGAIERAGRAGARRLGIGALLGLYDWRVDRFWTALHVRYLQKECWQSAISVSFPRLKVSSPRFTVPHLLSDREFVQLMLATRLFLPEAGINLSTREPAGLRDGLMPLGVTMMWRRFLDAPRRLFSVQRQRPGTICDARPAQSGTGFRSHTPSRVRPGLEGFWTRPSMSLPVSRRAPWRTEVRYATDY